MKAYHLIRFIVAISFLSLVTTIHGQENNFYQKHLELYSKGVAHNLAEKYKLDAQQCQQVEKIFVTYYKSVDSLRNSTVSKATKESSGKNLIMRRDNALKAIFPANKWKKFQLDAAEKLRSAAYETNINKEKLREE